MRWRGLCAFGSICVRKAELDLLTFAQLPFDLFIAERCEFVAQLGEWISTDGGHDLLIFGGHVASACWGAGQVNWEGTRRMVPTECGTAVQRGDFNCQLSVGVRATTRPCERLCGLHGVRYRAETCLKGPGECFASSIRRWHAGAWSAALSSGRFVAPRNCSTVSIL